MIGGACNGVQAVEGGERLHFVARELLGGCAHLLIDIIPAAAFGECRKLPFNVGGVLSLQRRRAEPLFGRACFWSRRPASVCFRSKAPVFVVLLAGHAPGSI